MKTELKLPLEFKEAKYGLVILDADGHCIAELAGQVTMDEGRAIVAMVNRYVQMQETLAHIVAIWGSEERNESVTLNRYIRDAKELLK